MVVKPRIPCVAKHAFSGSLVTCPNGWMSVITDGRSSTHDAGHFAPRVARHEAGLARRHLPGRRSAKAPRGIYSSGMTASVTPASLLLAKLISQTFLMS
jgi:hypothetical protein